MPQYHAHDHTRRRTADHDAGLHTTTPGKHTRVGARTHAGAVDLDADDAVTQGNDYMVDPAHGWCFAFFFTGHDAYGKAAQAYVSAYYPQHIQIAATSFEDMFAKLDRTVDKLAHRHGAGHVEEIVLVAHANKDGGMKIPLTRDKHSKHFTPWNVTDLQDECGSGLHKTFQAKRSHAISAITTDTRVVVRGCNLGQSEDALEALRVMMGGEATVMASTAYQGFSIEPVGPGWRLKTNEEAFDWLVSAGYLAVDLAAVPSDRLPAAKDAYVRKHFPDGIPTEFFTENKADHDALKKMSVRAALAKDAEQLKHRPDEPFMFSTGTADWATVVGERKPNDLDFEAWSEADLVAAADKIVASYSPELGARLVRLYAVWKRKHGVDSDGRITVDPGVIPTRPDAFSDDNLARAEDDARAHPEPARYDAFTSEPLGFTKPSDAGGADHYDDLGIVGERKRARPHGHGGRRGKHASDAGGDRGRVYGKHQGEAEKLPLDKPELFRLWNYAAEDMYLGKNHLRALANFKFDLLANDRLISIVGHASTDEDAPMGSARAFEVEDELRRLGIPAARIVESHGAGTSEPLEDEAGGGEHAAERNRRVEIHYVKATDYVPLTEADAGHAIDGAPPRGKTDNILAWTSLGMGVLDAINVAVDSFAIGLFTLLAPFIDMIDTARSEAAAAKNAVRDAFFTGVTAGAFAARGDIDAGANRVDDAEIADRVARSYRGSRNETFDEILGDKDLVLSALSSGSTASVDLFEQAITAVEKDAKAALHDNPEASKIYPKIIQELRKTAADYLYEQIITVVRNEHASD